MKDCGVVVLIREGNKFLLLKDSRDLMLGKWAPPHGRCEDLDKDEKATVKREVLEEVNLKVLPLKKVWQTKADTKVKTVSFWLAKVIDGKIKLDKKESSEFGWFTIDEALALDLYPGTRKFFVLLRRGEVEI